MYRILVVDDEIAERDGLRFLIEEYKLPLIVVEATDGEAAWKYLQENPVDILMTDIKMPFMDGLQLTAKARAIYSGLKIIIFSAYDQFEYAKEAIKLNVIYYILKPVIVDEFLDVMNRVIELCEEESVRKSKEAVLSKQYEKIEHYEKERLLLGLINGSQIYEGMIDRLRQAGIDFGNKCIQLVMFDFKTKFFEEKSYFSSILEKYIGMEYEFVNLNEKQSMLFLKKGDKVGNEVVTPEIWEEIKGEIQSQYRVEVCIVVGQWLKGIDSIHAEYVRIEQTLDYKFFFDGSIVLSTGNSSNEMTLLIKDIDQAIKKVYENIDTGDYSSAEKWVDILFETIRQQGSFSSLYLKYTCMEITQKLLKKLEMKVSNQVMEKVEKVFRSETLSQLKNQILSVFAEVKEENTHLNDEFSNKVIVKSLSIIHESYMTDISLESIAEKVYLSPAYLSNIFKKATGQSLIKYLTAYRLEKAREMLDNTNMKIADVAQKAGYTNFSYFCWVFRTYFGVSPTKFRESGKST